MSSPSNSTASKTMAVLQEVAQIWNSFPPIFRDIVVETAFWGAFTLLTLLSTYILLQKDLHSRSTWGMLAVTLLMYGISSTSWALTFSSFMRLYVAVPDSFLVGPTTPSVIRAESFTTTCAVATRVLTVANIMLNDCVVMWRACVVWRYKRLVVGSACGLLFIALVPWTISIRDQIARSTFVNTGPFGPEMDFFSFLSFIFSWILNLFSTSLIAYKAWQQRRGIQRHMANSTKRTRVENLLILLTESGVLYCIIWILYAVHSETGFLGNFGDAFLVEAMVQMTGIYPTIIIVLVCLQKTHCDRLFVYERPLSMAPGSLFPPRPSTVASISKVPMSPSLSLRLLDDTSFGTSAVNELNAIRDSNDSWGISALELGSYEKKVRPSSRLAYDP
ncbi:hypothetical protein OF83DRAFT_1087142 [Amylostereum chailletii]|nr:hypothetical protein OF83DRAFT_1087142 [Amylostereum chailletii]